MDRVFLDTAYAIALSVRTDRHHAEAAKLSQRLEENKSKLVTTQAVLLEIGNALSKVRYRAAAVSLLFALEHDPTVEVVPLDDDLFQRAVLLFSERPDKEWGMIDCVSMVGYFRYGY